MKVSEILIDTLRSSSSKHISYTYIIVVVSFFVRIPPNFIGFGRMNNLHFLTGI